MPQTVSIGITPVAEGLECTTRATGMSEQLSGDLWMWLQLIRLQCEVVRSLVEVVWDRFGGGSGSKRPQSGPTSAPNDPDRTSNDPDRTSNNLPLAIA